MSDGGQSLIVSADMYAALLTGEITGDAASLASQQMLRMLMEATSNAAWWKDLDSRFLVCNQVLADFSGVSVDVVVGKSDRDMPWADDTRFSAEWFIDWDRRVIESGEPQFGIIEQLRRVDGEYRWIETNKLPIRDADGRVIGTLGTFEDITDRLRAEQELKETLADLDRRVQLRTAELERANESLRREVDDRVRSQAEERQLRAYAEGLRDFAAAMSTSFDSDEIVERIIAGLERLVSSDASAVVLVEDGELDDVWRHEGFGYTADSLPSYGLTAIELDAIALVDGNDDTVIANFDHANAEGIASVVVSRMQVGELVVGYLVAKSATANFYTDSHAERLGAIADLAASAVSNARLAGRTSELAAIEERQRLARELHDAVNQTLWTAALTAESLRDNTVVGTDLHEQASRLCNLTRGGLAEMRSLLLELRPSTLMSVSLDQLIMQLVTATESRRRLRTETSLDAVVLAPDEHLTFYRVAQEAIGNVIQHSNANSLNVRLRHTQRVGDVGGVTELIINDDGDGFDPAEVPADHLGVSIMRERADLVDAELSINSTIGMGTTVALRIAGPS